MKKILFLSAVTMIAAVSCNKIENDVPQAEAQSFIASVDDVTTKTVIDGMKSYWDGTEAIRVLDGKAGKVYEATVQKSQTAKFVEKNNTVTLSGDDFFAIYPEGPAGSVTWDGNIASPAKKFWLPGEQAAVAGSYDPSTHIAVAYTEAGNTTLEYKNVVALVKVTVANDNVSEICFYGNSSEAITGNFDVLYNNGDPKASFGTGYTKNTYAKISGNIEKGSTYYISILPCTFAKGFSIEFVIDGTKYTRKLNQSYTVNRNEVIDLPVAEFAPAVVETTSLYLKPSSVWTKMNGRYAAYCWGTNAAAVWYDMTDSDNDGIYEVEIPEIFENVIFCSMNSSTTANNWDNKQEQTTDLTIPADAKNCYLIYENKWMTVDEAKVFTEPEVVVKNYLYLKPNSNWTQSNARFAAYFFGNGERWISMTDSDKDGICEVEIPSDKSFPKVIFCRMNPSTTTNNWNNKWNQTGDLTIPTDGRNLFTVPNGSWDGSTTTWSKK